MNINIAQRSLAIGLAVGTLGTAALETAAVASTAFASHHTRTARTAQPSAMTALMPGMAAPSAAPRPSATVATLTEAQVRAIAERTIGGHAEQVVPVLTTAGQSYSVWVDGANGVEVKLVLDARTGKVLSKVSDPQESPDPADSADPTDSPDSTDSPGVGSAAAEATQAPDAQGGSGG